MPDPTLNPPGRMPSIDVLRGLVMVLMALDHVRDFVGPSFGPVGMTTPEMVEGVSLELFLTRWVTHFCAPVFVFLAGTSAMMAGRRRTRAELSWFLLTRGVWLIILEATIIVMAWTFAPPALFFGNGIVFMQVIWAIGVSMIVLSVLVYLPLTVTLTIGLIMVLGHNFMVHLPIEQAVAGAPIGSLAAWSERLYAVVHVQQGFVAGNGTFIYIVYPLVPWVGVMACGYAFGRVVTYAPSTRRLWCLSVGLTLTLGYIVLRALRWYGDPTPWGSDHDTLVAAIIGFLNTAKYPPSLQFLGMTIGPALLLLVLFETLPRRWTGWLTIFGRVPMFFYVLHIPLSNAVGAIYFGAVYDQNRWLGGLFVPAPADYQQNLLAVYVAWAVVVGVLFVPCLLWCRLKAARRDLWWLSYL